MIDKIGPGFTASYSRLGKRSIILLPDGSQPPSESNHHNTGLLYSFVEKMSSRGVFKVVDSGDQYCDSVGHGLRVELD